MSYSRRGLLAASSLALLGGCGFEPVYGRRDDGSDRLELAAIALPDAGSELEFELRRSLVNQLNPTQRSISPRYRLEWRLERAIDDLAIQIDAVVTRQDLTLAAIYALVDLEQGIVVDRGRVQRTASFNISEEPFSDLVARQDANRRVAEEVAVALRQRLVAYFQRSTA